MTTLLLAHPDRPALLPRCRALATTLLLTHPSHHKAVLPGRNPRVQRLGVYSTPRPRPPHSSAALQGRSPKARPVYSTPPATAPSRTWPRDLLTPELPPGRAGASTHRPAPVSPPTDLETSSIPPAALPPRTVLPREVFTRPVTLRAVFCRDGRFPAFTHDASSRTAAPCSAASRSSDWSSPPPLNLLSHGPRALKRPAQCFPRRASPRSAAPPRAGKRQRTSLLARHMAHQRFFGTYNLCRGALLACVSPPCCCRG